MQNDWFSGRANSKEHKSEHICRPKTTNIIPSLICQPQVAIQRMIDPTRLIFCSCSHSRMRAKSKLALAPRSPPPGSRPPTHRSRLPTPYVQKTCPNSCGCLVLFVWFDLWSSSALDHKSYHKKHKSYHQANNTNATTNHTTQKKQKKTQVIPQKRTIATTNHTTKNTSHTTKKTQT